MKNQALKIVLIYLFSLFISSLAAAAQANDSSDQTKYITLQTASSTSFKAYVAGPHDARQAILLIHGWWGLNNEMESWANEFAVAGYRVMAIDLYDGHVTRNPVTAKNLMKSVKQSVADQKYAAAIKALSAPGRKIAIMGRSYGASQAIHAALVAKDKVAATIVYYPYGELVTSKNLLQKIKTPILGHFASNDFFLKPKKVNEFKSATQRAGLQMTVNVYEARHGFDNVTSSNFDKRSHTLAQQRTRKFLNQYLN